MATKKDDGPIIPSEVEDLLDPTSKDERAFNVAAAYHDLGVQLDDLDVQQTVANRADDRPIAWAPGREGNPNGWLTDKEEGDLDGDDWDAPGLKLVSYGRRRELLERAKRSLYERNAKIWSRVEEKLEEVQKIALERRKERMKNPNPGVMP